MSQRSGNRVVVSRVADNGMPFLHIVRVLYCDRISIASAFNKHRYSGRNTILALKDAGYNSALFQQVWDTDKNIDDLKEGGFHFINEDFNKLSENITDEILSLAIQGCKTIMTSDVISAFNNHFMFKTGLSLTELSRQEIELDSNSAWGSKGYSRLVEKVVSSFSEWVEKYILVGKHSEYFKDFEKCNYNIEDEIKLMRDSRERISHFISRHSKELSSHLAHKLDKPVTISDVRAYIKLNIDNSKFTEIAYNSFSPDVKLAFSRSKYADEKVDFILDSIFLTSYPNLYAANYLPGFAHDKFDFAAYSVKMFNQQARDAGSKIEPMPSLTRYETKYLKTYISALEEALLSIPDNSERALNGRALLDEAEAGLKNILISTGQLKVDPEINVTDFTRNGLEEYLSDNFSKEALIEILNDSNADLDVNDLIDEVIERFRDGDLELNGLDNTDFSLGTSFRP